MNLRDVMYYPISFIFGAMFGALAGMAAMMVLFLFPITECVK
jgi:uncharacterized membrane protein